MPKRKTLPKEFDAIVAAGDVAAMEAVMQRCDPNATAHNCYKFNALGYANLPEVFVRWLIDYGTDIGQPDQFGNTPLIHQAANRNGAAQIVLYLQLGADIEQASTFDGGPLHRAADRGYTENVRALLAHGANIHAVDRRGRTPLERLLASCSAAGLPDHMDTIELLLQSGAQITEQARQSVARIGADLEFRRRGFSPETAAAIDAAITQLYAQFHVPPAPRRPMHDGVSPITVPNGSWQSQYQYLWDFLVPSTGACRTVQGEVIRINGRISSELLDNGGIHWDRDFHAMLDALPGYLAMGHAISAAESQQVAQLQAAIHPQRPCKTELYALCALCVSWVCCNPTPIPLNAPPYHR